MGLGLWRREAEHVLNSLLHGCWRQSSCRTSVEDVVEVDDVELEVT